MSAPTETRRSSVSRETVLTNVLSYVEANARKGRSVYSFLVDGKPADARKALLAAIKSGKDLTTSQGPPRIRARTIDPASIVVRGPFDVNSFRRQIGPLFSIDGREIDTTTR